MRKAIKITDRDLTVTVECLPAVIPIEGNAVGPDGPAAKREESRIRRDLKGGNSWAWCAVRVTLTYRGVISASAMADGESYRSEREFKEDDLYQAMKQEALVELNRRIALICATKGA